MSFFEWEEFSHEQYFNELRERVKEKKVEPKKFIGSGEDVDLTQLYDEELQ